MPKSESDVTGVLERTRARASQHINKLLGQTSARSLPSAIVRSKIIAGFRKATADALAGGDFEATGIRQLDDERIVGVWAAE